MLSLDSTSLVSITSSWLDFPPVIYLLNKRKTSHIVIYLQLYAITHGIDANLAFYSVSLYSAMSSRGTIDRLNAF